MVLRVLALLVAMSYSVSACKVPVFRYALERWASEPYKLRVHYKGTLDSSVEQELIKLSDLLGRSKRSLNLLLEPYDVSGLSAKMLGDIAKPEGQGFPSFALYPPGQRENGRPVVVDHLSVESVRSVINSPVRSQIVKALLSGESAVWVFIKSGDGAKDAAARVALDAGIAKAMKELKISEEVVPQGGLAEAEKKGEVDLDDVLHSSIPLKISFKVIEVDPKNPAELVLIKMLTKGKNPSDFAGKCLAAPIFGRGRCLGVTVDQNISAASIYKACEQLCGECSCTVKSQSPGYDIVLSADWQSHVDTSPIIVDKVIPDLTGSGDFISSGAVSTQNDHSVAMAKSDTRKVTEGWGMKPWMYLAVVLGAIFLLGTLLVLRKSRD